MSDYTPETETSKNSWANYTVTTDDVEGLWYDRGWPEEALDRWLAELIRKAKADAWEEGWGNGNVYGLSKKPREENYINPYRGENK